MRLGRERAVARYLANKKGTHFCVPCVVTRTGIGRSARRALVAGGSEDHSGLHSLPPCSIPLRANITKKQKADTFVPAFSVVTRTGIEPVLPP